MSSAEHMPDAMCARWDAVIRAVSQSGAGVKSRPGVRQHRAEHHHDAEGPHEVLSSTPVVGRYVLAARPLDDTPQPLGARRAGVVRISLRRSAPSARRNLFLRAEALLRMMAQEAASARVLPITLPAILNEYLGSRGHRHLSLPISSRRASRCPPPVRERRG